MPADFDTDSSKPSIHQEGRRALFDRGPSGRVKFTSLAARRKAEQFTAKVRAAVGGTAFEVRRWPYRYSGTAWWAFDAEGDSGSVSLTFVETGKTDLPMDAPRDGTGEVADAVDAHYLFELLERELSSTT